ncbi:hypothetical protein SUV65_10655, partial [Streptococcus agalactiae]
SEDKFIQELNRYKTEIPNFKGFNVWILGDKGYYQNLINLEEIKNIQSTLKKERNEDYVFVKLNWKIAHDTTVFLMNKKHKLLKNIEEFKTITQKRLTERVKFPYDTVHSTFEIKDENFIMERLKSSGLSMGKPVDYMGVNGIPIYTKTLSIDNKFAFENNSKDSSYSSNINISEDKIKENDQKILDLIVKSGA